MLTPLSKLPNFEPESMPVLGTDGHLPRVPPERLTPAGLRERFARPPLAWQPELRREIRFSDREPAQAAVLVPLVMRAEITVLLTERTAHLSTHSGQIAFPGGKTDDTDADAAATALREAHEEVGLGTAFIITPVVALVEPGFVLVPNVHEVADSFEVPLAFLMDPANHRHHAIDGEGVRREWLSMPFQDGVRQRFIWGATAGMLRNLYGFLAAR
jgi:8-oxo-dGTP pyrophosphatase MutT (NUDIX family)